MLKNVQPSTGETALFQPDALLPLNVFSMAAVGFLAASGTTDKSAVVPSALSQLVLRGHSPA